MKTLFGPNNPCSDPGCLACRPRYADSTFIQRVQASKPAPEGERHWQLTGGSSGYYKVEVHHPTTGDAPYMAECNDIIEALGMNFAEGNAFKALWRKASARLGNGKPGNSDLYDAEKVVFFGERLVAMARHPKD